MTILVVIFAEVLPKTYAISEPDRTALFIAPILRPLVVLFAPVAEIVKNLVRSILRLLGANIGEDYSLFCESCDICYLNL